MVDCRPNWHPIGELGGFNLYAFAENGMVDRIHLCGLSQLIGYGGRGWESIEALAGTTGAGILGLDTAAALDLH